MDDKKQIPTEEHVKQIELYSEQIGDCELYADVLARILRAACAASYPEALVQARAKSLSSFAEKVARKYPKYRDAVNQFSDLCAARVVVQTAEQVKAVQMFIEANFTVLQKDDKGLALSESTFGYRDMHYIVQLPPERDAALRITPAERKAIGGRRAELQVRTWLQHAWADTLHDRLYKTDLLPSSEIKRTGNLLAALMEEADRTMNQLADELDGMIANYSAFARKEDVDRETELQKLIFDNEPSPAKKPALALRLARLAMASGDYPRVVDLLHPYRNVKGPRQCELLLDLGDSLCRQYRGSPASPEYEQGLEFLKASLALFDSGDVHYAPLLRQRESLHARALGRLAWALELVDGEAHQAMEKYRLAHEAQPDHPYHLAQMLGFDKYFSGGNVTGAMRGTVRRAIKTCREHAIAGMELPFAFFTAGRLCLLVDDENEALAFYARGIRHCLAGEYCMPRHVLEHEVDWLMRMHAREKIPPPSRHAIELLKLARAVHSRAAPAEDAATGARPVLIVAGGAGGIGSGTLDEMRPFLAAALSAFEGTVVSGGTAVGVPGCVGDIAKELNAAGRKRFRLLGYVPETLPYDAPPHPGYDELVKVGDGFQADQVLRYWSDVLSGGTDLKDVSLLGIGGGKLSAVEYQIAVALGATVGLIAHSGGSAQAVLDDPLWSRLANLMPLPTDQATLRAFANPSADQPDAEVDELVAKALHKRHAAASRAALPPELQPWDNLPETFRSASREQARHLTRILGSKGFSVRAVEGDPVVFEDFSNDEVEQMAELEHGRWNVDRLRDGWRHGDRDNAKKLHNCLVPWSELPEEIKDYDRNTIRESPIVLATAKLEVFRNGGAC